MIVTIPIEIKGRELHSKLLICYYLLKFNPRIKILLTKSSILLDSKIEKKNVIYFEKSLSKHKIENHKEFLKNNENFVVDTHFDDKLIFSVAPQGYLKKIK